MLIQCALLIYTTSIYIVPFVLMCLCLCAARSIAGTLMHVVQTTGPSGLWKGNLANVLRIIPSKGVLFLSNDWFRDLYGVTATTDDPWRLVLSGASAGALSTIATYPLDLVRSRLMMEPQRYTGIVDCLSKTVRQEGFFMLYKGLLMGGFAVVPPAVVTVFVTSCSIPFVTTAGLGPTLCGIMPYSAIMFSSFDLLKKQGRKWFLDNEVDHNGDRQHTPIWLKLGCGALAGVISQVCLVAMSVPPVQSENLIRESFLGICHSIASHYCDSISLPHILGDDNYLLTDLLLLYDPLTDVFVSTRHCPSTNAAGGCGRDRTKVRQATWQ